MVLFIHTISGILLSLACYIWYFTESPFVIGNMVFLFAIFPLNLLIVFRPIKRKKKPTTKQKLFGSAFVILILGGMIYLIASKGEDYFFALFKNVYFLGVFWLSMICGIVKSYKERIKAQQPL